MDIENGREVGTMYGRPKPSNVADWRMHIPFPDFAPCSLSRACSHHCRENSYAVRAESVLGGLHHEYYFAPASR